MEKKKILKQMFHISRPISRDIIRELLKGPCTIEQLRVVLDKSSRSSILRILDELQAAGMVKVTEIDSKRPGRKKKQYAIHFLSVPAMSNQEINMLLNNDQELFIVQEIDNLSFKLKNIENITFKTRKGHRCSFSPTRIMYLLTGSGLSFQEAFHIIFFDISENLYYDISEDEINNMILSILKIKYPFVLQDYQRLSERIRVKIGVNKKFEEKGAEDFDMIACVELGIQNNDSFFLANEVYQLLQLGRIREIDYMSLVFLMHTVAANRGIQHKKPELFKVGVPKKSRFVLISRDNDIKEIILNHITKILDHRIEKGDESTWKEAKDLKDYLENAVKDLYPILMDELEHVGISFFPFSPIEITYPEKKIKISTEKELREMNSFDIEEYLIRFFCLDEKEAEFVAKEALDRIQRLSLQKYSLPLLMEICKGLLREYGIEYRKPI